MVEEKSFLSRLGTSAPEVMERLHQEIRRFQDAIAGAQDHWLTPREEGAWSPAQISEHVMLISRTMAHVLRAYQAPELPPFPKTTGTYVNGKKQSPPYGLPGEGKPWADLEPDWIKAHIRLVQAAEGILDWQDQRTVHHPYFGELNVLEWLQVATFHLIHHRRQMTR
ncbi:DinB family protein [Deinococcus cellulosilyticus]|uniref:DinB-like domain-containing protein n=1 Tax=Deinococcus cellulosilyticus (strain DSM 18568 / NBRC 106333 / KACC 11606 / 5516J-15) TaxID=1223518 RepID=A0A511N3P0_DEIC1|nr:DinB family protein [Deinococcus cellulosilyticus]GEM47483.1 hypothetical protein DC3_31180 [Deinococcus cellulosilyticus NBRC 106333 = KACC 11606]